MYSLSRLLLMASALALLAGLAGLAALTWPAGLFVFMLIALFSRRRRRLSSHGTARWINRGELREAGLLGETGLVLGYHVPLDEEN